MTQKTTTPEHHKHENRPMQEAFRVLAYLRDKPMAAVFVHFNLKTLGYRVTKTDCAKSRRWAAISNDQNEMKSCAGVYRLPISATDIADDLHAMGVPLEVV